MCKTLTILFLFYCCYTDGTQFRSDYKYYKDANGWLKLHQVPADWHEARLRCHLEGAVLASPLNEKFLRAVTDHMAYKNAPLCGIFSGVHATFSRGDYSSIEGVPLSSLSIIWAPNEPDNFENSESCLIFLPNGTLADVKCSDVFPYMCYKEGNFIKTTACGTIDTQYNLDIRTGSCYKFHSIAKTWSRAYMTCAAEGGYLAIINSRDEAKVLRELFAEFPDDTINSKHKGIAAVGIHDWGEHGTWLTIHGQTLKDAGYDLWPSKMPNNGTGDGHTGAFCGFIERGARYYDMSCNDMFPFICEKNPNSLVNEDN